jgi:hypothetical protein
MRQSMLVHRSIAVLLILGYTELLDKCHDLPMGAYSTFPLRGQTQGVAASPNVSDRNYL